ncbi:MAG: diacylglycerol kinase family protein [Anaerolineaceae bacterium]|nr:diacylglycerol kinase family protein [Anaerolineaceae bacterium]
MEGRRLKNKFTRSRLRSIRHALGGWWYVIRTQQNAWIHALATVLVIIVGIWLEVETRDWALLVLAIAMVWTAEFLNTALEVVVDLASPDLHPLAKVGKDVGAASVLIAALSSIIIGVLVMGPAFLEKVRGLMALFGE